MKSTKGSGLTVPATLEFFWFSPEGSEDTCAGLFVKAGGLVLEVCQIAADLTDDGKGLPTWAIWHPEVFDATPTDPQGRNRRKWLPLPERTREQATAIVEELLREKVVAEPVSPWRDVATDPPTPDVAVIGLWADGVVQSVKRIEVGNFKRWRFTHGDDPWASPPLKWMPIPEVPK